MAREQHCEAIEALIREVDSSDDKALRKLRRLVLKATQELPIDHTTEEMISALETEFQIFIASTILYDRNSPDLSQARGSLLARFAKFRGWLLIVESRNPKVLEVA